MEAATEAEATAATAAMAEAATAEVHFVFYLNEFLNVKRDPRCAKKLVT